MIGPSVRRVPRQDRSRESERRLLAAARELLAESAWDEISVAAIAARAGLAVGAFYARFASKEALFEHLAELAFERTRASVAALAARAEGGAAAIDLLVELVNAHIALYRDEAAVTRALVVRSRVDAALREQLRDLSRENYATVAAALARAGARQASVREVEFALYVERSVLREAILFGEGWSKSRRFRDAEIAAETVRLLARYLGLEPSLAVDRGAGSTPGRRPSRTSLGAKGGIA